MKNNLENAINRHFKVNEQPINYGLLGNIQAGIKQESQLIKIRKQILFNALIFILFLTFNVFTYIFSTQNFFETSILNYLSFIFTDFNIVFKNWQDFSFLILESLPVIGTLSFILSIIITVWLIDFGLNKFTNIKQLFTNKIIA